jgi:hypothetical protein
MNIKAGVEDLAGVEEVGNMERLTNMDVAPNCSGPTLLKWEITVSNPAERPLWDLGCSSPPLEAKGGRVLMSGVRGQGPPASAGSRNSSSSDAPEPLLRENQWGQGDLNPHSLAACGF